MAQLCHLPLSQWAAQAVTLGGLLGPTRASGLSCIDQAEQLSCPCPSALETNSEGFQG